MTAVKWLSRQAIEIIHQEQLAEHGGLEGLKDENSLEATLARPLHKHAYGEEDLCRLAAAYVYGFARSHPFSEGNKRTAYLAAFTFLLINGYLIQAGQAEIVEFVLAGRRWRNRRGRYDSLPARSRSPLPLIAERPASRKTCRCAESPWARHDRPSRDRQATRRARPSTW